MMQVCGGRIGRERTQRHVKVGGEGVVPLDHSGTFANPAFDGIVLPYAPVQPLALQLQGGDRLPLETRSHFRHCQLEQEEFADKKK